ncbi:hypothetical protein HYFRA_00003806 [Hymenoscyphus fraxineus]|uniref:Uncharacterized protein n=1 Tax=Hymenoscyphus fraxineus TaxID=746836 RepID=A0A9N9PV86_9HELO|nr:hypothetical protein HYFRA_00003806 [Hymenoscyphus fraxineus]
MPYFLPPRKDIHSFRNHYFFATPQLKEPCLVRFGVTTTIYPPSSRTPSPSIPSRPSTPKNPETTDSRPNKSGYAPEGSPPQRESFHPGVPKNHSKTVPNESPITQGQRADGSNWDDISRLNITDPATTSIQANGTSSPWSSSPKCDSALRSGSQHGHNRDKDLGVNNVAKAASVEEAQEVHKEYLAKLSDPFNVKWKLEE